jgi:glyoxylase-like metal-dependent hydrolase (beta-lactamase superfamily II)
MQQIMPGVCAFTGLLMGRVYALEDVDGLTLVDTGLGLGAKKVLMQLQANGRQPSEVKRILITHAHPDHVGGLPELQAATSAQVIAHVLERPVIEGKVSIARRTSGIRLPDTKFKAAPVHCEVQGGETLPEVLGGLQVIFTPGHAPGHICFWQPDRRLLFCGDVLMRLPRVRLPFAAFTVDMEENKRSVKKLAELEASVVCFGHGQPLMHDAASQLRAFAAKL